MFRADRYPSDTSPFRTSPFRTVGSAGRVEATDNADRGDSLTTGEGPW